MADKEPTFEDAFKKLEEVVQKLEQGSLTLEQAIAVYEEGMRLVKIFNDRLNSAELKVTHLQSLLAEDS